MISETIGYRLTTPWFYFGLVKYGKFLNKAVVVGLSCFQKS